MTQCTADFETGVNGATISAADPGSATAWNAVLGAGGAIAYDNAHPAFGALGGRMVFSGAGATWLKWAAALGTVTEMYGRAYLYLTGNPPSNQPVICPGTSDTNPCARIDVNANGTLKIVDSFAGAHNIDGAVPITLNQQVRIEWHLICSTTVGFWEAKLFNSAQSLVPSEVLTSPATWNTQPNCTQFMLGYGFAGVALTTYWDNIIAGANAYPGPVGGGSATPMMMVGV